MATAQDYSIDEPHCVLCCEDMDYSACGSCDHPICLKCCVKLRLLRKEHDCPVCRAQLKEVIVSKGYKSWADKKTTKPRRQRHARNYGILHESPESQAKVDELLEHKCTECNEVFRSFPQVKDHIRKAHSLMFCDICLRHLKIFTHERKCYTREDLVRHRKEGDMDDRSHRGHPLCQFCDERYLDNDELLVHLRKHHFWCHICEKDGKQDYYANYNDLRRHFKRNHFLCEDGECLHEKFTSVFRLKVDFQAHVAQNHSNKLTKAEARQMRQLDINVTFAPRKDPDSILSAQDFHFPEQGYERYRERPRITSSAKDKDGRRESQRNQNVTSNVDAERYKQTSMGRDTENSRGARRNNIRSPRDVLEGDHKRPPGIMGDAETNDKRIFDDSNKIRNVDQAEEKNSKSGKVDADGGKTRKNKSKKKELLDKNLAGTKAKQQKLDKYLTDAKAKQQKLDKYGLGSQENKTDSSLSKTKNQESNESSSDQKSSAKSKSKNNNSGQEKTVDVSLTQNPNDASREKSHDPSSSSVVQSPPNTEDDFPAFSADKKQKAPVNIVKRRPTYDSEFPTLSNESRKQNSSIRPPPGLAPPPGFSGKLKRTPSQTDPAEAKIESGQKVEQFADLNKVTTKNKLTQPETQKPERLLANKSSSKSSVPNKPAPKPTYETEFPTLATLTTGHKASSSVKAPPGSAPPGFQPGIPARPPPGMGWSVPINMVARSAKETRSQKLLNDIRRILNLRSESFERFREVSGLYRQGKSSPEKYYQECCSLLGKEHIHKVFCDLIDLLPDEEKQRQLLVVYNDAKVKAKLEGHFNTNEFVGNSDTEGVDPTEVDKIENGLVSPPSLEDDFPELSKTSRKKSKPAGKVLNAWTRVK